MERLRVREGEEEMKTKDLVAGCVMAVPLMLALVFSACDDDQPIPCMPAGGFGSTNTANGGTPSSGTAASSATIVCVQNAVRNAVDPSSSTTTGGGSGGTGGENTTTRRRGGAQQH